MDLPEVVGFPPNGQMPQTQVAQTLPHCSQAELHEEAAASLGSLTTVPEWWEKGTVLSLRCGSQPHERSTLQHVIVLITASLPWTVFQSTVNIKTSHIQDILQFVKRYNFFVNKINFLYFICYNLTSIPPNLVNNK
jgi:hypothetical protein